MFWELDSLEDIIARQVDTYGYANKKTVLDYFDISIDYYMSYRFGPENILVEEGGLEQYLENLDRGSSLVTAFILTKWVLDIMVACDKLYIEIKKGPDEVPPEKIDEFITALKNVSADF